MRGKGHGYLTNARDDFALLPDKKRTFVQQPDGSYQKGDRKKPAPVVVAQANRPGADIFVPGKTPKEGTNWVPLLAAITSMLASTASVVIAMTR